MSLGLQAGIRGPEGSRILSSESEENRCQNCLKVTEYLKVLTSELKSAQLTNKILSEELNTNRR
jgi:hypothetical protein